MPGFNLSYQWLHYTRPSGTPSPAPEGLERHWLKTPQGRIEVLSNTPSITSKSNGPPIVFCHGGMGCAWVWTEYMQYLAARGVQCYAVSLRGHGESWHPSYFRMVFATPRSALASDLVAAIEWVQTREEIEVMLVGHSSGGGLSQGVLSDGMANVKALALLGAVPGFGSMGVYLNWWKMDPWFTVRMIFHLWHSNSPLSHPKLTQRAFFGDKFPLSAVIPFQRHMNRYESYMWPFSMMYGFASASNILRHIRNEGASGEKVLVMAGTQDKLMTAPVTENTAAFYREAGTEARDGVRLRFVEGAGHHLQNDIQWEDGAEKLFEFYKGVA
ncbi:Alpha/Beta hydrolase protein [Fusarium tricinctum]|uniref:Alpha/Beta hydrolase protein n=1 Tax=Fusarium tricinctum TaxID=61284 RepID=A0A8K0SBV0_9HYPO|nr:Alpha/Beta hydrolase protein [Fusarium tricinctum]